MIDIIQLENYRCFEKTQIKLKEVSVFVGKNNAGKSSLIEALRLVALAIRKSTKTVYKELPMEFGTGIKIKGFKLDVEKLKIDLRGIVYLYEDKIAKIKAVLSSGNLIIIYLNSSYAYACVYDANGNNITNKNKAELCGIESVEIMPQLGLIKENEKRLSSDTVENDKDSYLFSRHFRNEIYQYKEEFWDEFVDLSEKTWPGLKINEIIYNYAEDEFIKLFVSDSRFLAELGLMGSGLQMWLQIMWFLSRTKDCETIILDEPDVYMHPDLQRKLIRIIQKRYPQTIIATHSVEIIAEVSPKNIVIIDKKKRQMSYSTDMQAVQKIVDNIGSINNLSLARIGNARKCVFVEGKDLKILAKFADILYPELSEPINNLPHVSLGGFNNLPETFGAAKLFYEETMGNIMCICILDSDYFPEDLLKEKIRIAEKNNLILHIWKRKEIENYILEPKVLFRLLHVNTSEYEAFLENLENLVDTFEDDVFDQYATHIAKYKKIDPSTANKEARKFMNKEWDGLENKLALVSGKNLLRRINQWMHEEYGVKCTLNILLDTFKAEDVCQEMKEVIAQLVRETDMNE